MNLFVAKRLLGDKAITSASGSGSKPRLNENPSNKNWKN
jgi:hypothetical protein